MAVHGLVNRSIQCFLHDTYGADLWGRVVLVAELSFDSFEALLTYDDALTDAVIDGAARVLDKPRDALLEDLGTYLVSHPNVEALRRLLRFGGEGFEDFLHSLDELPDRARLAVPELSLPPLELRGHGPGTYTLTCRADRPGFGRVLVGVLRAMADDYGALVLLEHAGSQGGDETIAITLLEAQFAEGRRFDLATRAE